MPMKLFTSLARFQITTPHSELVMMGKTKIITSWHEDKSCSLELGSTYILSSFKKIGSNACSFSLLKLNLAKLNE
jgi:hypothetical protein